MQRDTPNHLECPFFSTFCSKIKEDEVTSHIPVILLTARSEESQRIEGYEHGPNTAHVSPSARGSVLFLFSRSTQPSAAACLASAAYCFQSSVNLLIEMVSFHYNMRNTLTISCFHLTIKRILFQPNTVHNPVIY